MAIILDVSYPRKKIKYEINNAIFESKMKGFKLNDLSMIGIFIIFSLLNGKEVSGTSITSQINNAVINSNNIINTIDMVGEPTIFTAVEAFKWRHYFKIYYKNLKAIISNKKSSGS